MLCNERRQRRMARLVGVDRKALVTQIVTPYDHEQKSNLRSLLMCLCRRITSVSQEQKSEATGDTGIRQCTGVPIIVTSGYAY